MCALLLLSQIALNCIPNTELVTFLIILFTIYFGKEMFVVVESFAILEIFIYGFGLWNFMYLYIWALLVGIVLILTRFNLLKRYILVIVAALYGLSFGALCTIVYIVFSPWTALSWWIAGIPMDCWHSICNGVIMFFLYDPVTHILNKLQGNCRTDNL